MLRKNFLKEKLQTGSTVLGTWSVVPSAIATDIIASSGLDFVIIDSEHGPISFETAQNMVVACESRNVSPVMRVGGVISAEILRALEIGVHCVQIPNITTVDEVRNVIAFCKYPPVGNRGFSPFTRAGGYSHENSKEINATANESTLVAIQIEGRDAIEQIHGILAIKEVDIVFIGLYDLSKSLGILGQVDSPLVLDVMSQLTAKILDAGKYPGTIVTNEKQLERIIGLGMKYITYSVDCEMLLRSYKAVHNDFRKIVSHSFPGG